MYINSSTDQADCVPGSCGESHPASSYYNTVTPGQVWSRRRGRGGGDVVAVGAAAAAVVGLGGIRGGSLVAAVLLLLVGQSVGARRKILKLFHLKLKSYNM